MGISLRKRLVTIIVLSMMLFACSILLGSKVYATGTPVISSAKGGYESVTVTWGKVDDAVKYMVYANGVFKGEVAAPNTSLKFKFDPFPADTSGVAQKANVVIYAYDENGVQSQASAAKVVDVIHPMYVVVKPKGKKLKLYPTAKSNKAAVTLGKNALVVGYGGYREDAKNKRIIVKYGGKTYYVKSKETKIKKYVYNSGKNNENRYTAEQVLDFINDRGITPVETGSKGRKYGKKMIWVNTYNQRLYLFEHKNGKWDFHSRYPDGLLCNTGKELTPYGLFRINGKWEKKRSTGTRWWCIFKGVGVHQKLKDALGKPTSGGCVRIATSEAKRFYKSLIGKKTPILVY